MTRKEFEHLVRAFGGGRILMYKSTVTSKPDTKKIEYYMEACDWVLGDILAEYDRLKELAGEA